MYVDYVDPPAACSPCVGETLPPSDTPPSVITEFFIPAIFLASSTRDGVGVRLKSYECARAKLVQAGADPPGEKVKEGAAVGDEI